MPSNSQFPKLSLYSVSDKYINYMRKNDKRVYDNKQNKRTHTRKYLGVVLSINGFNYYIPLSSPKSSDYIDTAQAIPRKSVTPIIRITDSSNTKLYGTLRTSNMIPIPITELTPYNIHNETDLNYKNIVLAEISFINLNKKLIFLSASRIYNQKKINKDIPYVKNAVDFLRLEEKCKEWEKVHNILPTLNYIKNEDDLFYIYDNLNDKNNFDRVVKILDNDVLSKNITSLNIKDLENKRIPSVQEITTSVYEKIKDTKEINFDDLLNDLETFLDLSGKFQDVFDNGKFIKPLSEQEVENIKVRTFEYFKNLYRDEETDGQDPNLEDNTNNSNPPKDTIYKNETYTEFDKYIEKIFDNTLYIENLDDLYYIYDKIKNKSNFEKVVKYLDNETRAKDIYNFNIRKIEEKQEGEEM